MISFDVARRIMSWARSCELQGISINVRDFNCKVLREVPELINVKPHIYRNILTSSIMYTGRGRVAGFLTDTIRRDFAAIRYEQNKHLTGQTRPQNIITTQQ